MFPPCVHIVTTILFNRIHRKATLCKIHFTSDSSPQDAADKRNTPDFNGNSLGFPGIPPDLRKQQTHCILLPMKQNSPRCIEKPLTAAGIDETSEWISKIVSGKAEKQ